MNNLKYSIHYDNNTGPGDDGYWEWYEIHNDKGDLIAKTDTKQLAEIIVKALTENEKFQAQLKAADEMEKALEEIVAHANIYTVVETKIAEHALAAYRKAKA